MIWKMRTMSTVTLFSCPFAHMCLLSFAIPGRCKVDYCFLRFIRLVACGRYLRTTSFSQKAKYHRCCSPFKMHASYLATYPLTQRHHQHARRYRFDIACTHAVLTLSLGWQDRAEQSFAAGYLTPNAANSTGRDWPSFGKS
jgi:hypothetical protein